MQIEALQIAKQNAIINSLLNHQKNSDSLITVALNCCATGATHKAIQNNESNDTAKTSLEIKLALPAEIYMSEAHPNPNNGSTKIDYELPTGVNVGEIVFYNLQGNEIKRFKVDRTFNTLLISTKDIAAGTYYYQLQTVGESSGGRKMVVVK